jgi:fimbrial chaperone protein
MSQTIDLGDGQKQALYLVDNPTTTPMAVEISLRERVQKEDGTEEHPVTKDLSAFPPQLIVPPKEKRTVRVNYLGGKPGVEKSYRVIAEQLPLEVDGKARKGTGIKMLLKYVAALYVDPGETTPKLMVEKIEVAQDLAVTVANTGSQHAPLTNAKLTLTSPSKKKMVLEGDSLKGMAGENILAGSRRVFRLSVPAGVDSTYSAGALKID